MKLLRYTLALSLLLPTYCPSTKCDLQDSIAKIIGSVVVAGGIYGLYKLLTGKPAEPDETPLALYSQAYTLCNNVNSVYDEELKMIGQYQPSLYTHNASRYDKSRQENIREDLIERFMGRGTGEQVEHPLHYHENTLNTVIIKDLNKTIIALAAEISKIDVKLIKAPAQDKRKLTELRAKYVTIKDRCENLKKHVETIRGAIMKSAHYLHEQQRNSSSRQVTPPSAAQMYAGTTQPHPTQQQDMQQQAPTHNRR